MGISLLFYSINDLYSVSQELFQSKCVHQNALPDCWA